MTERTDLLYRSIYATDASMYQMLPSAVATPASREEVLALVHRCIAAGQPMVARGGGTSLTGQAINQAQVVDLSKHLHRVLELNLEEGWVRVEPGIVCAELNAYLAPHGVQFAPDPATQNRATIGGMIANNSAGMRSVCYGMTIDHVLEVELALSTGEIVHLSEQNATGLDRLCAEPSRIGQLHQGMRTLVQTHDSLIRERYPRVIRRSGGYALDALLDFDQFNLAKLLCGSEGTLGLVLAAKLRLTPLPPYTALCLAHFSSLDAALRAAPLTVSAGASAAELIDGVILGQARQHPLTRDICYQIQGDPAAVLVIEVQGDDWDVVQDQVQDQAESLATLAYATPIIGESEAIAAVWQMRSSALGLMTTLQGRRKPTPYIEDAAVPPEQLADYVAAVLAVCQRYGQPVSMFGHASVGLVHIRPLHDLHRPEEVARMEQIQSEVFSLVRQYGGSWSGEHGDGIVRGGFNRQYFGADLYGAFRQVKQLFDPVGLMNPGKIIDTPPMASHLRYGPAYQPQAEGGRFRYPQTGGLLAAAEQCSGVGACRKTLAGVMCPSYMATRDELHSTRGRANALRLALSGQLDGEGLASPLLAEAMDLCLACTGCKAECPNGVDMARLKAETRQAHHDRHGVNLRTRLFAHLPQLAELATGPQAALINAALHHPWVTGLMQRLVGIASDRPLPPFASQRLSQWFRHRPGSSVGGAGVVLLNETYTEHFLPQVGRAAVECLEAAGLGVTLATVGQSQRMAISQGLLDRAKVEGGRLLAQLDRLGHGVEPILVCEPSSATALTQDLPDLVADEGLARRVAARVVMWDRFLAEGLASGELELPFKAAERPVQFLVHTHCHQKQMDRGRWTHQLLSQIPGATVVDSGAGCCGMAGTFGYEVEHAELSRRIAGQRLLPLLEQIFPQESVVVANGFSCRHQIGDLSGHRAVHGAEALRAFIDLKKTN
jgi:FAD/FMN-containing dehydrogenase/Fe-S oxidoreductase